MNQNLESLMRDVARTVQAEARRREILPEVERRLAALDVARPRARARAGWRFALGGLTLSAAAAAFAFFFVLPRSAPLSYSVAASTELAAAGRAGAIGDRVVGPATGALALRFSDGSQVTVPSRAEAHVDALDARGATVAVEQGTVEVSVVHRDHTRWEVRAGRYQIHVTGTRFAAGWDPRGQTLTVTMHEGSVAVTGPGLKEPMRVVTGQRLRANVAPSAEDPVVSVEDAETPEAAPTTAEHGAPHAAADEPSDDKTAAVEAAPVAPPAKPVASAPVVRESHAASHVRHAAAAPAAAPQTVARAESDWRALAARTRYDEALASATREGWRDDCARLGVEDVMLLGDIARYSRDFSRAEEAYQAARRRFPSADRPVYYLALVAFEGRHDYAGAARLFDAYVRYFPHGPLAREAAGRLIEARIKAGETGSARDAAADYLHAYPDGPHAALARRTVGP
jgi:ferric-dicitrate binding protein FerR (iron transport regulator)